MIRLRRSTALLLSLLVCASALSAPATRPTSQPFETEIEAFEAKDQKHMPAPGGFLFVGSSSIRKWTTLAEDFPGLPVINRGFGGSCMVDSVRYAPRIVLPYQPKTIFIYAGDNDIPQGRRPEQLLGDFKAFVDVVRKALPETRIFFIAIKPSPSRWKFFEKQTEANRLVREYTETDKTLGYIDVVTPMLGGDGQPREELYVADKLHMTREGYELWTGLVKPYLK